MGLMARWWSRSHDGTGLVAGVEVVGTFDGCVVVEVPASAERHVRSLGYRRGDPGATPEAPEVPEAPEPPESPLAFDILKGSVRALKAELDEGVYDGDLVALRAAEVSGKDRTSALDAIDDRMAVQVE